MLFIVCVCVCQLKWNHATKGFKCQWKERNKGGIRLEEENKNKRNVLLQNYDGNLLK